MLALREVLGKHLERDTDRDAKQERGAHTREYPSEQIAAALFAQECGDDADDECGFQAFPQADHEGGEHPPIQFVR